MIVLLFAESHLHLMCMLTYMPVLSLLHWRLRIRLGAWKLRYCQEARLNINEFIKNEGSLIYYYNLNVPNRSFLSPNQHILQLSVWLAFLVIASGELCAMR